MADLDSIYDLLEAAKIANVVVRYNGSGDEGYIDECDIDPPMPEGTDISDALWRELREAAYDVLEDHHAGWEINEGSEGEIKFDAEERTTILKHGERIESVKWYDPVVVT